MQAPKRGVGAAQRTTRHGLVAGDRAPAMRKATGATNPRDRFLFEAGAAASPLLQTTRKGGSRPWSTDPMLGSRAITRRVDAIAPTSGVGGVRVLHSRDCESAGMSHETPAPPSRTSVVASARERARPTQPRSARPIRRLQEAQHMGGEQVGGGVHCGVSLPRHDRDAAVRQSPPQRLAGCLERFAAVAALEI